MADYYTQFSTMIENLSTEEVVWIKENISGYAVEDDFSQFDYTFVGDGLWIYSEEDGVPDAVAGFVQAFLKEFRPQAIKVIGWANTCSKPRVDSFWGGMAVEIGRASCRERG